jgi:hypothetical protein
MCVSFIEFESLRIKLVMSGYKLESVVNDVFVVLVNGGLDHIL